MKPTIYDVAEKAGVSIATVSKVVNNTGRISDKTRQKVSGVMKALNYYPSSVAAALTGKKTFTIGLLVPDIANPFFAEMSRSLENYAREAGYTLILCSTDYKLEREQEYLELLIRKQVDGIMIAIEPKTMTSFQQLSQFGIPYVLFSVDYLDTEASVVTTDNVRGGYMAGKYLLSKGHRDIAIIAEMHRQSGRTRLMGFQQALAEGGVSLQESHVIHSRSRIFEAKKAAEKILNLDQKVTAVFAATDLIAIALINEARKSGLQVPDQLSVIGFDNTIYAEMSEPGITTLAQPINELSRCALEQLLNLIKKTSYHSQKIMLPPTLVERESVKQLQPVLK